MFERYKELERGKIYSYKEIAEILDIDYKESKRSRDFQKEKWRRYFEWENPTSQKYIITYIYDEPLPEPKETRGGNNHRGELAKEFQIILDYFLRAC